MSIFDDLFRGHRGPSTNVSAIEAFEKDLDEYEAAIKHESTSFEDFRLPALSAKRALMTLCMSDVSDTISMMRRLTARVAGKLNEAYSDYTINMLASATHDREARELIMALLFNSREMVIGENVELGEAWLGLVRGNMAILQFFENYRGSDQGCEESYSGESIAPPKDVLRLTSTQLDCKIKIGYNNYDVLLNTGEQQTVSFGVEEGICQILGVPEGTERLVITSDVILTPSVGHLILDRSINYSDDAVAQLTALRCAPAGVVPGCDVRIILPSLFYSLMLSIISYDAGLSWRVVEVNVLPPSVSRMENR